MKLYCVAPLRGGLLAVDLPCHGSVLLGRLTYKAQEDRLEHEGVYLLSGTAAQLAAFRSHPAVRELVTCARDRRELAERPAAAALGRLNDWLRARGRAEASGASWRQLLEGAIGQVSPSFLVDACDVADAPGSR